MLELFEHSIPIRPRKGTTLPVWHGNSTARLETGTAWSRGTMLAAGVRGTAAGDWVAEATPLGLAYGSLVLVVALIATWFVSEQFGRMTKPWYWLTIVAARTAGTTLGDLLASRRGLALGLVVSTICTSLLLAGVVVLWRRRGPERLQEA
jgi:uncharacterized membrane-anchored protein